MDVLSIISKWFWLACILVTFINGCIFWRRAQKQIEANPDLKEGYKRIIRGFLIWGNVPWVVMGIGCTLGGVTSLWDYFNLKEGNPYVLAFFASVIFVWVLGSYWIFLRNGAAQLANHPGLFNADIGNPLLIKLIWCSGILGGAVGIIVILTQSIPVPEM